MKRPYKSCNVVNYINLLLRCECILYSVVSNEISLFQTRKNRESRIVIICSDRKALNEIV